MIALALLKVRKSILKDIKMHVQDYFKKVIKEVQAKHQRIRTQEKSFTINEEVHAATA